MANFDYSYIPEQFRREVASVVGSWFSDDVVATGNAYGPYTPNTRRAETFDRKLYRVGNDTREHMRAARAAVRNDDIVGGLADVTEGMMFQGLKFESLDTAVTDVFNQLAADLDLDTFVRQVYRELYTYSQAIVGVLWGRETYQVRGRRKKYELECPTRLVILDPMKVIPVVSVLGDEDLYWHATESEVKNWRSDPVMSQLIEGPCTLPFGHKQLENTDPNRLLKLNPKHVFRHTATKPDYARYADVRIRNVFRHLDLKQQLMDADRAALVGNARYIVLIRRGSDAHPATAAEIQQLREKAETIASLPVLTGDHTLQVDVVAPRMDLTLDSSRYDTLDRRILARLLGALTSSSTGQRNESTLTVARMVGRTLESKRHMIKRAIEKHIVKEIVRRNPSITKPPSLVYYPARVELDTESTLITMIQDARIRGDLSRESFLEFAGYDQATEAMRRQTEQDEFDDIFRTATPYDSPENNQSRNGSSVPATNTSDDTESEIGQ